MKKQIKPNRPYNSARRQAQARETRRHVVEAARRLFTERGYAGATVEAIAQEAGVAVETVYAIFGNKKAILSRLVDVSVVGDEEPVPLLERPGPRAVKKERDQRRQIRLFAQQIRDIMTRMAPLFDVMRTAAKTEPDIAELLNRLLRERLSGMTDFIAALTSNGPLRRGLSQPEAAETVWAITSAEVFSLVTADHGWSGEQYETWLANTLTRLLLP
jgi:AcrR family transcriptional regulator